MFTQKKFTSLYFSKQLILNLSLETSLTLPCYEIFYIIKFQNHFFQNNTHILANLYNNLYCI